MSVKLKPYPAMKDSGAPWLGKVPEHWETWRLKYLLHERDSRSADGREQLLCVSQYTGVTQRLSSDGTEEPDTRAASLVGYRRVQANELVVNIMLAWNGSMGVSRYDGIASPAYCVYRFVPSANPWYFHHLLRSPTYKAHIKTVSTGVVESRLRLYSDDLYKIEALLPPLPEQSAIVRFLDHADRRIRRYIRAKQKLIKLLEEQKQAIIHRAVTRGLDPNVRLKPSGVPWLGDVPEHWEVRKLRSLFRRHGSGTTPAGDAYYGGGIPWIMTGDLTDTVVSETKRSVTKQALMDVSALRLYPAGSLAVAMYGATIGKTGVFGMEACTNQACCVLAHPLATVNVRFVQAVVVMAKGQLIQQSYGGGQPNINAEIVRSLRIPVPTRDEQDHITRAISDKAAALDAASQRASAEISLLREYRTRLIADVVTGKVDVREAAVLLPDEAEEPESLDEGEATEAEEMTDTEEAVDAND